MHRVHRGVDFWTRAPLALEDMVLDHVWPRALGGPDSVFNLVPTHAEVNLGKHHKTDLAAATAVLAVLRIHYGEKAARMLARLAARGCGPKDRRKGNRPQPRWSGEPREIRAGYMRWMDENREEIEAALRRHRRSGAPWVWLSQHIKERGVWDGLAPPTSEAVMGAARRLGIQWRPADG